MSPRNALPPALGLLVGMALAACTAPVPGAPPTPSSSGPMPSASPSASLVADPAPPPTPALAIDCADLLTPADLSPVLASAVAALEEPSYAELETSVGPLGAVIRHARGLECEWSNGEPPVIDHSPNPAYVGAVVQLLPDASEEWNGYAAYYGVTGPFENCSSVVTATCEFGDLVRDVWVDVRLFGLADGDGAGDPDDTVSPDTARAARVVHDAVGAAVDSAAPSPAIWAPPADAAPLGPQCDWVFSPAQVDEALDRPQTTVFMPPDGGVSIEGAARERAGTTFCLWTTGADAASAGGSHSWLSGGEWAFRAQMQTADSAQPLRVDGLAEGEAAYLTCADDSCSIDVLASRGWVQVTLLTDAAAPGIEAETATRLAELVVTAVHA